ncbi:serine threonine-protein kinase gad8 [Ophiostoma piceae UAMH 11346]|uniref:Serine threonine-protein kinase gad8 n=1 Tax=Ophiostoma piceae (strain UAMH 11346) TaxID=1262450 RepID=S3BZA2_OPHP1|nr:serine threonine-protein kinase gad8 [Ophiostoma piceae UAMH 11346]
MSTWKLTKKLKETHLGPLANFSRSTSTSTITPEKEEKPATPAPAASLSTPIPPSSNIAASEALTQTDVVKPPKPGILVVTLHEGQGFALPEEHRNVFNPQHQSSVSTGNALASMVAGSVRPSSSQRPAGGFGNGSSRPQTSAGSGFGSIPTNHGRISGKYMPYALLDFDRMQVFVNSVEGTPENPLWAGDNTQYKFDVSRVTELAVHLYLRNPSAPPGSGRSQDIFLGVTRINPRFEASQPYVEDPKLSKKDREKAAAEHAARERQLGFTGVDWVDVAKAEENRANEASGSSLDELFYLLVSWCGCGLLRLG